MRDAIASHRKNRSGSTALIRTNKTWDDVKDFVKRELDENPLRAALYTVGAGYVLGGGLFSGLTSRLVGHSARIALRAISLPVILRGGMELGSQLFGSEREPAQTE